MGSAMLPLKASSAASRVVALFVVGVLLVCLSGCNRPPPVAEEEVRPAPVKAVAARLLAIGQWTELLGTTQPLPDHVARVSSPFEGRVVSVLQDSFGKLLAEGQAVQAGQVIAQLDTRLLTASRTEAKAALVDLEEQKKQADFSVDSAQVELKKYRDLGELGRTVEIRKAELALQDALSKQRGAVAKLEAGHAKLAALDAQLELSTLRAPINGRLGLIQVAPGQSLAVGASIAEVVNLEEVDVLCFVPPRTAARLTLGLPARIKPTEEANAASDATGKVVYIAVSAQPETGNYAVKIRMPNHDLRLRANAVVTVEVRTQPEKERLTIPDTALLEDQDPPMVVVIQELKTEKNKEGEEEKKGKAKRLRAIVGVRDRNWHVVEILRLEDPETKEVVPLTDALIVVEGGHGLHDADLVKIDEEAD